MLSVKTKIQLKKIPVKKIQLKIKKGVSEDPSAQPQQILLEKGVVVLPVFDQMEVVYWNHRFQDELLKFPEFVNPTLQTLFVCGSFGGFNHPSNYHNPMIRQLRMRMMPLAQNFFRSLHFFENGSIGKPSKYIEQLFDSMCIRRKGTQTTAKFWHRDVSPNGLPDDQIFGGWINLDVDQTQYFSCVPGTHRDSMIQSGLIEKQTVEKYESAKQIFEIPPGHWILFFQQIAHEVLPKKMSTDSYRVFLGFRLTDSTLPLYDHTQIIEDQGVPFLPGGHKPSMYSSMDLRFRQQKLIEWSSIFQKQCLEQKTFSKKVLEKKEKLGLPTTPTYDIVHLYMKSLKEYGLTLYPPYTEEEINIMKPQKLGGSPPQTAKGNRSHQSFGPLHNSH